MPFLSDRLVAEIVPPSDRQDILVWDDKVIGFCVRVWRTGRKTWTVTYRDADKRSRRIKLGNANIVDANTARADAREVLAQVTLSKAAQRAIKQKPKSKLPVVARRNPRLPSATTLLSYLENDFTIDPRQFAPESRHYVYAIRINGVRRYVGKGQKNRIFQHAPAAFARLSKMQDGAVPRQDRRLLAALTVPGAVASYEILGWFEDAETAFEFEARCIDLLGTINRGGMLLNIMDTEFKRLLRTLPAKIM